MTAGFLILLIILSIGSLFIGAIDIDPGTLISGKDPMALRIFLSGRIPRLLAILCTGVGMSVSGLI
ncbi:MAG: iron chelate uptake ABC transporter family permease subunit, partial [Lachnospiraceae bacterium]|nr:iron chelate uptake ABC transporter family permease subunit [Lachnospiraceae bacterium]